MALDDPEYSNDRLPGDHVQSILRSEAAAGQAIPEHLLRHEYRSLGTEDIAAERYFSPEFHSLEVERMWKRVWQIACRIEDLPRIGSHYRYDLAAQSLLVVRVSDTEIKAYHNSCLLSSPRPKSDLFCLQINGRNAAFLPQERKQKPLLKHPEIFLLNTQGKGSLESVVTSPG